MKRCRRKLDACDVRAVNKSSDKCNIQLLFNYVKLLRIHRHRGAMLVIEFTTNLHSNFGKIYGQSDL